MYNKKYSQYKIKIEYLNGDIEEITYDDNLARDYKQSLDMYRETKEHYKNDCVIIKFCGVTEDNEINILYQKNLISDEDRKEYEKEVEVHKNDTESLLKQHKEIVEKIDKRFSILNQKHSLLDKEQDIELHNVENFKTSDDIEIDIINKLKIFNKLQEVRVERREVKDELSVLAPYIQKLKDSKVLKNIESSLTKIEQKNQINNISEYVIMDEDNLEELNVKKRVKYPNIKQRDKMLKEMKHKYDKLVCDDVKMEIICYNRGYKELTKKAIKS